MRVLALDIGSRRTGVAISDPTGILARPLATLEGAPTCDFVSARLRELLDEYEIDKIVMGHPRRMGGESGPEAVRVATLADEIAAVIAVPIVLWDERLSTVEASARLIEAGMGARRRRKVIDQVAATVILQSYLDAEPGQA